MTEAKVAWSSKPVFCPWKVCISFIGGGGQRRGLMNHNQLFLLSSLSENDDSFFYIWKLAPFQQLAGSARHFCVFCLSQEFQAIFTTSKKARKEEYNENAALWKIGFDCRRERKKCVYTGNKKSMKELECDMDETQNQWQTFLVKNGCLRGKVIECKFSAFLSLFLPLSSLLNS